jgi:biotin carboxylase
MDRALAEFRISGGGMTTTLELHRALLRCPTFRLDAHTAQFLDNELAELVPSAAVRARPRDRTQTPARPAA